MHAAMHGHSGIVDTLLLHGADARLKLRRRPGGGRARGGVRPAGVARRALPRRPVAAGGARRRGAHRLPLGSGVAPPRRRSSTCSAAGGSTARSPPSTARATRRSTCAAGRRAYSSSSATAAACRALDAVNRAGLTPADAIAAAGVNGSLAEAVREAANDDERPPAEVLARWQSRLPSRATPDARLFLPPRRRSACRRRKSRRRARGARATGGAWLRGGVSLAAPLLLCASPRLFLALPFVMVPALVAALLLPQRLGGCLDDGQHGHGHGGGAHHGHHHHHRGAPHRRHDAADGADVDRTPALLLCGFTALELALHAYLVLPQALREAPTLAALSLLTETCLVAAYISLVTADPGFVAGGDDGARRVLVGGRGAPARAVDALRV